MAFFPHQLLALLAHCRSYQSHAHFIGSCLFVPSSHVVISAANVLFLFLKLMQSLF
jgi:hypothetical protein